MKTIYKYQLETTDEQNIKIHKNARILCVQTQNNNPCLWAEVDTDEPLENRLFVIIGTGHPMWGNPSKYIGTYQLHDGILVFHVFEILKE